MSYCNDGEVCVIRCWAPRCTQCNPVDFSIPMSIAHGRSQKDGPSNGRQATTRMMRTCSSPQLTSEWRVLVCHARAAHGASHLRYSAAQLLEAFSCGLCANSRWRRTASLPLASTQLRRQASLAAATWHGLELKEIFKMLSFFQLNIDLVAPECFARGWITFERKWWIKVSLPFVFATIAAVFLGTSLIIRNFCGCCNVKSKKQREKERLREEAEVSLRKRSRRGGRRRRNIKRC